jgi:hypothetical protein
LPNPPGDKLATQENIDRSDMNWLVQHPSLESLARFDRGQQMGRVLGKPANKTADALPNNRCKGACSLSSF